MQRRKLIMSKKRMDLKASTDFPDIDSADVFGQEAGQIDNINIIDIFPDPDQPRKNIDAEKISELAETIKENGLIQPILIRHIDGGYAIIAGERRYHACKEAGLRRIPCIIKVDISAEEAFKLSLIENLQREDLDPFEEAAGYLRLNEKHGMTHEDIAKLVGKARTTITKIMAINSLPESVRKECGPGHISKKYIIKLAESGITDEETLLEMIADIKNSNLTSKQISDSIKKQKEKQEKGRPKKDPVYVSFQKKTASFDKAITRMSKNGLSDIPDRDKAEIKEKLIAHIEKTKALIEMLS